MWRQNLASLKWFLQDPFLELLMLLPPLLPPLLLLMTEKTSGDALLMSRKRWTSDSSLPDLSFFLNGDKREFFFIFMGPYLIQNSFALTWPSSLKGEQPVFFSLRDAAELLEGALAVLLLSDPFSAELPDVVLVDVDWST